MLRKADILSFIRNLSASICLLIVLLSCAGIDPFYGLSSENYKYIVEETKGGNLDFEKQLDKNSKYNYDDKEYTAEEMALIMWGRAVRLLGIKDSDNAVACYEHIHQISLSKKNKKAIKIGFENK